MGQPVPPQPPDGNPYGQQPGAQPYGQQPGSPAPYPPQQAPGAPYQAFPQQQPGPGFAPMPPPPATGNMGLGVVAAIAAGLIAAAAYGLIVGLTKHEIGYAAIGVGFIVGLGAGKVGGRNMALPVVSALVALGSVYLGQMIGEAMIGAKQLNVGFSELFFQHFSLVHEAWKADADGMSFVFFAIAAFAAFGAAKKSAA
ncbi:hypothetical protein [Streptomyces sp. NPDC058045]|uniref:hypothetical protein n=1 Tax=Streptomyces sp. NPDC058045 TaxID=3346311 RepID=UPI0036E78FA6